MHNLQPLDSLLHIGSLQPAVLHCYNESTVFLENTGENLKNTSTLPALEKPKPPQHQRFEDAMRRIVKVSKEELKKREETEKAKINGRH